MVRSAALASIATMGFVSIAGAQAQRGPNPNAPRLMVSACRTADKALAIQCADKLRATIEGDVSYRTLYVLPKADVENTLTASGYDPSSALAPGDASALAKQIRADEYIDATVEKVGAGFKLTASLVPQRDPNLVQPLGSWENAKLDGVMGAASKAFQDAHNKTFDRQKNCQTLSRERKYGDALKEISDGLKDFPNSTWLRYCQMSILKDQKAPNEQILKLAEEINVIDPMAKGALQERITRYEAMGNKEKQVEALLLLQKADPTNPKLNADIGATLAGMGDYARARPIIEKALSENPGDLTLARYYWLILAGMKDYKKAIEVGDEMIKMDSASADTAYFSKSINYAIAGGDTAKAAEIAHRAGAKFPKVIEYPRFEAGVYSRNPAKVAEANAAFARVLAINPKEPGMRAAIAKAQIAANQLDAALATAKQMIAGGEDKNLIAGIAVGVGDALRKIPDQLRTSGADPEAIAAAWEKAYQELAWADTLAKGTSVAAQAKFLMGLSALSVGQGRLVKAGEPVTKATNQIRAMKPMPDAAGQNAILNPLYKEACTQTNAANDYLVIAQLALPAGGSFAADATRQLMGNLMQLNTSVDQMTKGYCNRKP